MLFDSSTHLTDCEATEVARGNVPINGNWSFGSTEDRTDKTLGTDRFPYELFLRLLYMFVYLLALIFNS